MQMRAKRKQADMGDEMKNIIFPSPKFHHHSDSACVVRSTRVKKPLHYTLKIQSFSLLKIVLSKSQRDRYESQSFTAGGYKWKLALYRNGDVKKNGSGHISLYLVMAEDSILSNTSEVNVVFTFLVYDNLKDKYLTVQDGKIRRFHEMKTEWGFGKLISLDTFNDASNGFLVDDCCAFGVDIFVMKCEDGGKGEVLSLIKQPQNNKFTWKFNNFSQLNRTYYESDPFTVESYKWRIGLYPRGSPSATAGFLSLYLVCDGVKDLLQGSQVYVESEMTILNQLGIRPSDKEACNLTTFYAECWFELGDVGDSWGTPNFMSLNDIKEPTRLSL